MITLPPPPMIITAPRAQFYVTDQEIDVFLGYERSFSYVRETQPNEGPEVEVFQAFCYGKKGDSWCADFQCFCYCGVWPHSPLRRNGSCQGLRESARTLGWLLPMGTWPQRGDIGLSIDVSAQARAKYGRTHAHHAFGVEYSRSSGEFDTIEGNTNPDGGSNGYGVFLRSVRSMHLTTSYQFIRFPRKAA